MLSIARMWDSALMLTLTLGGYTVIILSLPFFWWKSSISRQCNRSSSQFIQFRDNTSQRFKVHLCDRWEKATWQACLPWWAIIGITTTRTDPAVFVRLCRPVKMRFSWNATIISVPFYLQFQFFGSCFRFFFFPPTYKSGDFSLWQWRHLVYIFFDQNIIMPPEVFVCGGNPILCLDCALAFSLFRKPPESQDHEPNNHEQKNPKI